MLTTSVIPNLFVWASEEVQQEFGDSESLGFGSTSDTMSGGWWRRGGDQELTDFQDMPDVQNGNDTVDMESGFTDECFFGSNGSDTPVESGFQSLASVEELQKRINALPTVEEFKNLADGTTVDGSTLNQAQTDVYGSYCGYCGETGAAFGKRAGNGGCK